MKYVWMLLLLLWVPITASAEIIEHIGSTNPADEGWYVMSGIAGEPDETTEPSWRIATMGYGRWAPTELGAENFEGEWTLHVRAKWNEGAMATQRVTIFDGLRGKSTAFTWDANGAYYYVGGQGDTLIPNSAPDGQFHDLVLTMDGWSNNMIFAYDGVIAAELTPAQQNNIDVGRYLFYFGDNEGRPELSDVQYARVSLSNEVVPEPTTWTILLMGILSVATWRRWRS